MIEMARKKEKPRRAKGTGSVKSRGNRWYGFLRKNGEEILTEPCATEGDALKALDRLIGGGPDPRFLPTLQSYWESLVREGGDWEDRYDEISTVNLYETVWAKWVEGTALGKMRLDQIRRTDCQRWVDRLYKRLAESTVRRYGSCLHTVLAHAVEAGLLQARVEGGRVLPGNPADEMSFRAIPDAPSYVFSDEELVDLPQALYQADPVLAAIVTVLCDTGARPGEVCAMRVEDIRGGVWHIADTRRRDGTLKGKSKTGKSRTVALSPDALAAIAEQGRRKGPVFLNQDGNPVRPGSMGLQLRRYRDRLQKKLDKEAMEKNLPPVLVPPLTARNFRKTFVTRGVELGDVKSVQAAVGHASAKTTLDVYAKARKDPQSALIQALAKKTARGGLFTGEQPSLFGGSEADRGTDRGTPELNASRAEPA